MIIWGLISSKSLIIKGTWKITDASLYKHIWKLNLIIILITVFVFKHYSTFRKSTTKIKHFKNCNSQKQLNIVLLKFSFQLWFFIVLLLLHLNNIYENNVIIETAHIINIMIQEYLFLFLNSETIQALILEAKFVWEGVSTELGTSNS
jgi:hypothetical protein